MHTYAHVCTETHVYTLLPGLGQGGEQVEAGPKRYSRSRDCRLKKVAGTRWVILLTKILEQRANKLGGGGHQAETSSVQEAWLQEVGRGD